VPPFPDEQAFAIIERDLGRPLGEVFSSISERPVAAASLGQARRRPGEAGRRVWGQGRP
jgi:predicted unusual protein kinase regulating ubiquinone biosynthesis (AarF/ABC1/UbiB family)